MHQPAEITLIEKQMRRAIRRRLATNAKGENATSTLDISVWKLARHCKRHRKQLRRVYDAYRSKNKGRFAAAKAVVEESFSARIMAVVRATQDIEARLTFAELEALANDLSLSKSYDETLTVRPEPKDEPGKWRTTCLSGRRRKMQQLMLRDIWTITLGDVTHDSSVAGAGGERALFDAFKSAIAEGYEYWVAFDIRNFFPSLRPGHLAGCPFPKWVRENLVFLPPETTITFVDENYHLVLTEKHILSEDGCDLPDGYPYSLGSIRSTLMKVRQELPQGDVIAPLIARTVLGRELRRSLKNWDVTFATHVDNVIIGARSQADLKASLEALIKRLKGHPAGPLELHKCSIRHIDESVYFLGYRVSRMKDGSIRIRPALERFDRFRKKLMAKFKESDAFTREELWEIAVTYAKQWFRSQSAWTKAEIGVNSSKCMGPSFDYVLSEARDCMNAFIYDEYTRGVGCWHEDDIDPDFLAQIDEAQAAA